MSTCAKATINLKLASEKQLATIFSALKPETKALPTKRANVMLEKCGDQLTLTVTAEDTVALRATLNTYLRWINSTLHVIDVIGDA